MLEQVNTCKGCTLGKYTKSSFGDRDSRAKSILERVHLDVFGPFSKTSTTKHRYYVIFFDHYSRKCWIFFMQKKDQTFRKFCEFKSLVEKESDKKVKYLRSDNYCEYVSNEFKNFCAAEGIKRELAALHNPQQNGVSERKNESIVGEVRVMLHDYGLPLHLWAEASNTMVYVHNRSPHQILKMKTLDEAYSNKRPDVGHFKIFGSSIYFHVTKDAWKKLDLTIELGIFVGYTDTPHNYRVYMLTSRMIVVRRDIKFNEEKAIRVSLERELELHADEEILAPKVEEPQIDVEQPHAEVPGVETSTQAESSREGRKHTREADRLLDVARENVGGPTSQCRKRRSLERYTRYISLMGACIVTEPSYFQEAVQHPVWVC